MNLHYIDDVVRMLVDGREVLSDEINPTVTAIEIARACGGVVVPVVEIRPDTLLSIGQQDPNPTGDVKAYNGRMAQCRKFCKQGDQWSAQRAIARAMRHGEVTFEESYQLSMLLGAAIEIKKRKHYATAA